tara:strand:+ start:1557 stop:3491 length:1935 start_codon:yes stop_codon:yes gene_type:complete
MEIYKKQTLSETLSVYFDRRMIRILLLGIISGFPWVLIGSSLSLWLKEDGLSRSTIGWAGLIFGVYAINFLWAPLIDKIRIPWLTNKIGHRRSWIVIMQFFILVSLVCWSTIDPSANLMAVIAIGLVIAFASATQDITVDALRIEQIGENEGMSMQAGAAMSVVGWWTGYKLGGFVALYTAEIFQYGSFFAISFPPFENYWQITFLVLGIIIIACNIGLMFVHEPQPTERQIAQRKTDQIIEEKLSSSGKKGYLKIIGGILFIFFIAHFLSKVPGIILFPFLGPTIFYSMIIPLLMGILGFALLNVESKWGKKTAAWISGTIGGPFVSFFKRNEISEAKSISTEEKTLLWFLMHFFELSWKFIKKYRIAFYILGFIFLFKIGEAFLGRMSIVFYKEIGFSKGDIAFYSKTIGWITTVVFTLLGGLLAIRSGVVKAMFISGILMALTNLLFSFLAWYVNVPDLHFTWQYGKIWIWGITLVIVIGVIIAAVRSILEKFPKSNKRTLGITAVIVIGTLIIIGTRPALDSAEIDSTRLAFAAAVLLDDIAAAFATVAFVAFISLMVDRTYTATQYALLASIGTLGRTTLAASSGALVDWLEGAKISFFNLISFNVENPWVVFFVITTIMVIPSLIFLYMIRNKLKLNG